MRSLKDIYDDLDVGSSFALLSFQPSSFEEAIKDENWVQGMDEEIEAIEKNDTWDLIDLPKDKNLIGVKWVYKTKLNEKGDFDIDEFKEATMKEFEMSDLGLMKYFLGIEVEKSEKEIFIYQNKYSKDLLKRLEMENCKPVPAPVATGTKLSKDDEGSDVNPTLFKRLVGSLMYLTATRPDIMQGVSLVSRFMETPKDTHWSAGKRILRYIVGTRDCGIMYASTEKKEFIGYKNSDFAGSLDDRKRTSSFVFHLGSGVISCASKK
eukprot:PITA_34872